MPTRGTEGGAQTRRAEPTRRLVTLMTLLTRAGTAGIDGAELAAALGFGAESEQDRRDQVAREIRMLRQRGFRIDNVAAEGERSRWRLVPGDDRVRLAFTAAQRHELRRAAVLIGAGDLTVHLARDIGAGEPAIATAQPLAGSVAVGYRRPPQILGSLIHAIAARCLIAFDYTGRRRLVHPISLRPAQRGWVLTGHEEDSDKTKTYSLQKIANLRLQDPGTAQPRTSSMVSLDPLAWDVDPPARADLAVPARFEPDVRRLLHEPESVRAGAPDGGRSADDPGGAADPHVRMTYVVTNRRVFLARLFELGERVRLVGDDSIRDAARTALVGVMQA